MSSDPTGTVALSVGRRWRIVVVSLLVTASAFVFINGVAFMIPALEDDLGTPLAEAGLLSSMPSFGMVATLILWGYVLDRVGERMVLTLGSALTAGAAYAAANMHSMVALSVWLFIGGMAAASCNSAGGRLVSGWFPPEQRGLAMGVRQAAQPLGIALGALVIPELAERSKSATSALIFPAILCAVAAALSVVAITDPPRKEWDEATDEELANPYRRSWVLRRIHVTSALLMVPQTVTVTFMLIWLITNYKCSIALAGTLVTMSQLLGGVGRVLVGRWSDRVGSRLRPVRVMSVVGALVLCGLAFADHLRLVDRRAADGRCVGGSCAGQRAGVHRDHRIRRPVLEWPCVGPAEHLSAIDGSRRPSGVRWADRRTRLSAGIPCLRAIPVPRGADRAGQDVAARAWRSERGHNPFADFGGG